MTTNLLRPPPSAIAKTARNVLPDIVLPAAKGTYHDLRRPRPKKVAPASVPRTTYDPLVEETIIDPFPGLERIREHPVWVNERHGVWMIGRHEDVHAAVGASGALSSKHGIMLRSFVAPAVLTAEAPDHARLRRVCASMFNVRAVQTQSTEICDLVGGALRSLKDGDVVDMVPAVAVPLPINVIARMLGVPQDQWPGFRAVSETFSGLFGPRSAREVAGFVGSALKAYVQLRSFLREEMRARVSEPAADVINRLNEATQSGEITDQEAYFYALQLLVAGNETTTNLLGMLLIKLAEDRELFLKLKADRTLLRNAVEEAARWCSPVQWATRVATEPYPIGDTVIPTGAKVMLFYASANRDPAKYADPDRFDIHRDASAHLTFGYGMHFCLGAHLARLEVASALDVLLDELDGMELAGPVRWATNPSLRGPLSVPARVSRR